MHRMCKFIFFPIIFLLFTFSLFAQEQVRHEDPSLIGHSERLMKTAGFWISRHPSPDAVIMSPEQIDRFNARLSTENKLTKDIFTLIQDLETESLLDDLQKTLADIQSKDYYTAQGVRGDQDFMDNARRNMNLSGVVMGVMPRYGLVVHYAPQRFLPTDRKSVV